MTEKQKIQIENGFKAVIQETKKQLWAFCKENKDLTRLSITINVTDEEFITVDYDA